MKSQGKRTAALVLPCNLSVCQRVDEADARLPRHMPFSTGSDFLSSTGD